jgi:putative peptidoglycan lipid II flippase
MYASLLATGSQTWLYLTDRLIEFPQGMIGVALATVILPHLSGKHARPTPPATPPRSTGACAWRCWSRCPATLGLAAMAEPITATLYQYGKFSDYDTHMAGSASPRSRSGFPDSCWRRSWHPRSTRARTRARRCAPRSSPVLANVILMSIVVVPLWRFQIEGGHAGIAMCTAAAGSLNAWLLWRSLRRQDLFQPQPGWPAFALRIALACAAMVAVLLLARHCVGPWQPLAARWRLIHLAWAIPAGMATYGRDPVRGRPALPAPARTLTGPDSRR